MTPKYVVYECEECGKLFYFTTDIEVTYSTRRVIG